MSYGVITYQEDVLLTAINLAGYTWEEADKLRKAMGKKIPKEMAAQKEKFIQGVISGGVSSEKAVKLWSLIEPFAAYGFGKAHAASYANVAYQTAYMKANFPVEFMAAVMTAESGDNEKIAAAVNECGSMGIQVLPPDVNESLANFTVLNDKQIRFGLAAIKNLGNDVIETIISERKAGGQFSTLGDFVRKIKTRNFNKKSWEALAKSGALDRFGERNQMLAATESVLEYARSSQRQLASGQSALFVQTESRGDFALKEVAPATEKEKLSWEKELLGLYVSSHPLKNHRQELARFCTPIEQINQSHDNSYLTVGGIITRVQNILTRKGEPMCFFDLEDLNSSLEVVVFPGTYNEHKNLLAVDQMVLVRGKINDKDGEIKILADSLKAIEDPGLEEWADQNGHSGRHNGNFEPYENEPAPFPAAQNNAIPPPFENLSPPPLLKIKIPSQASPQVFSKLKTIFSKYPGEVRVSLIIPDRENALRIIQTEFKVRSCEEFKTELKNCLRESLKH
ncbi:hypothetical protein D4R52_01870 [bacterium]|nr:MAG: hypothetical protein D4R52_01870 [bacterium]